MSSRPNRKLPSAARPAAFVKGHWRDVVAEANTHGEVVVTNHDRPEVVVMSLARYEELQRESRETDLEFLRAEFDRELAAWRAPGASDLARRLFHSTPAEIARAANAAALRRNKK